MKIGETVNKNDQGTLAVLWDMDGVLIDTSPFHFAAWKQVLGNYGVELNRNTFKTVFGLKNDLIIEKFLNKKNDPAFVQEIENRKESLFRRLIQNKISLLPGVHQWLEIFQSHNIVQAVASSAPKENVDLLLREANIHSYFSAIVSADSLPGKPDPSIFLRAALLLNVLPQNCVVIEDAIYGIQAAHMAGMKCIAVGNSLSLQELHPADLVVPQLSDLTEEAFYNLIK